MRSSVDFPEPLGPSRPKLLPLGTRKLMPSTARIGGFPREAYTFTRFSTSSANSLIYSSKVAPRNLYTAGKNRQTSRDLTGRIESLAGRVGPAVLLCGIKPPGALEERNFEKHSGHSIDCLFTVSGARAEVNTSGTCAGRAGSARLPDGQRGPHHPRTERISVDPEHCQRHAEYPEECGASGRDAGSARDRDALAA